MSLPARGGSQWLISVQKAEAEGNSHSVGDGMQQALDYVLQPVYSPHKSILGSVAIFHTIFAARPLENCAYVKLCAESTAAPHDR